MEKIKEINWAMVLSFLLPGLGQIGRFRILGGYLWFVAFSASIILGIYYTQIFFIIAMVIHLFNVLDSAEMFGNVFKGS